MKPALTPEEWTSRVKRFYRNELGEKSLDIIAPEWGVAFVQTRLKRNGAGVEVFRIAAESPEERHAMAAFCLDAQPFGFTRKDVLQLHELSKGKTPLALALRDIADRIEALLPPE